MNPNLHVTFFKFPLERSHLQKDVGKVPLGLSRVTSEETELWAFTELRFDTTWIKVLGSPAKKLWSLPFDLRVFWKIYQNRKKLKSWICFFPAIDTFFYCIWVRLCAPQARIVIKFDSNHQDLNRLKRWGALKRSLLKSAHLLWLETGMLGRVLAQSWPELADRIIVLPNGVDDSCIAEDSGPRSNIALIVSRHGIFEKNSELLLSALEFTEFDGWELQWVGPSLNGFRERFESCKSKQKGVWKGEVVDREDLYKLYRSAKVLILPSRVESFGIVLSEAQASGLHVIVSDAVMSSGDFAADPEWGTVFHSEDPIDLAKKIDACFARYLDRVPNIPQIRRKGFSWSSILDRLTQELL